LIKHATAMQYAWTQRAAAAPGTPVNADCDPYFTGGASGPCP
jgi:hypothetical protein